MKHLFAFLLLSQLIACSSIAPVINKPLIQTTETPKERQTSNKTSNNVSLILTFSGGGTRAAALSYGVLKGLRETNIPVQNGNINMLSEVDIISSVSGGSFTSAYYGLYGDRIFTDYERRFLKKPIQSNLIDILLNPLNWKNFNNRSELVTRYYERTIFNHKTFKDLRPDSPRIVINATDLSAGTAFSFTPDNFRWICSNLADYPIGRAVTASSAVPVLFSALPLKNYAGCKPSANKLEKPRNKISRKNKQALGIRKYQDKERFPYLHLVDGGITDNLGIRSLLHVIAENDNDIWKVMKLNGIADAKKVAFIVVNAAGTLSPKISKRQAPPSATNTMAAVTTIQLERYNADTLDLLSHYLKRWERDIKKKRCQETKKPDCGDIKFYLAELNFTQLPPKEALLFSQTETSMELPTDKVDGLVKAGQYLLKNSPEFQQLIDDLKAVK